MTLIWLTGRKGEEMPAHQDGDDDEGDLTVNDRNEEDDGDADCKPEGANGSDFDLHWNALSRIVISDDGSEGRVVHEPVVVADRTLGKKIGCGQQKRKSREHGEDETHKTNTETDDPEDEDQRSKDGIGYNMDLGRIIDCCFGCFVHLYTIELFRDSE